jgi:hypothetical protein
MEESTRNHASIQEVTELCRPSNPVTFRKLTQVVESSGYILKNHRLRIVEILSTLKLANDKLEVVDAELVALISLFSKSVISLPCIDKRYRELAVKYLEPYDELYQDPDLEDIRNAFNPFYNRYPAHTENDDDYQYSDDEDSDSDYEESDEDAEALIKDEFVTDTMKLTISKLRIPDSEWKVRKIKDDFVIILNNWLQKNRVLEDVTNEDKLKYKFYVMGHDVFLPGKSSLFCVSEIVLC